MRPKSEFLGQQESLRVLGIQGPRILREKKAYSEEKVDSRQNLLQMKKSLIVKMMCWSSTRGSSFCVPNTTCIIFHFTYRNTCALLLNTTAFFFSSSLFKICIFYFMHCWKCLQAWSSSFLFHTIFPANCNCFKIIYRKPLTSIWKEMPESLQRSQAGQKHSLLHQNQWDLLSLSLSHPTSK